MSNVTFPVQKSGISRKTRTALIGQGQRMSNWLYNIRQDKTLPQWLCDEAELLVTTWDELRHGGAPAEGEKSEK